MKNKISIYLLALLLPLLPACVNDLDVAPLDPDEVTSATFFNSQDAYFQVLMKAYSGLSTTGQSTTGTADITINPDEGFTAYLRNFWKIQELPTDEAVIAWTDNGLPSLQTNSWSSSNAVIEMAYSRFYFQIGLANALIRATDDMSLLGNPADQEVVLGYKDEARFLRALSYWHVLDAFGGNVPFVTEANSVGEVPGVTNASDLFAFLESELVELTGNNSRLLGAMQAPYARADKGAAMMLLAKLYMNAAVYTDTDRYADAATVTKSLIDAGYSLHTNYRELFMADNHTASGIIFPIAFDGQRTQNWGGMTFMIAATNGGNMNNADRGTNQGWGGIRTTSALVNTFPNGADDTRYMFFTDGQSLDIENLGDFQQGYAVPKFSNISSTGETGSHPDHADTDFPMFRLADAYLMYAECAARGNGDKTLAANYVNALRVRAYGDSDHNVAAGDITLDFVLDERARELYFEGHRRTDLRRHGKFTGGTYLWPWKGGAQAGTSIDVKYEIFPIPAFDLNSNPNLVQNPGY